MLSAAPRAFLSLPSCSPNYPRAIHIPFLNSTELTNRFNYHFILKSQNTAKKLTSFHSVLKSLIRKKFLATIFKPHDQSDLFLFFKLNIDPRLVTLTLSSR